MAALQRLILHLDVDAFFASVEQLLIPSLRGKPVAVGSGCIASCSYQARSLGLHAGMSLRQACKLCPNLKVLPGNYQVYRCFAEHVWKVSRRFTVSLETHLDEAYGDATGMERIYGRPDQLGYRLQQAVLKEVHLPVSVGLAANRMMAKIASTSAKPGGVVWIPPEQEQQFLTELPVCKLPGVGPKTAGRLEDMNVNTVGDLRALGRSLLQSMWGQRGELLYERSCGRDFQPLRPDALPKTISRETTFHRPTTDKREILAMLFYLLERAMRTARKLALSVGCVELTIRYEDFKQAATRKSLNSASESTWQVFDLVSALLDSSYQRRISLRQVGLTLSNFTPTGSKPSLFEADSEVSRLRLDKIVDSIRDRYGHAVVVTGRSIELLGRMERNDYGFVLRTPSLTK